MDASSLEAGRQSLVSRCGALPESNPDTVSASAFGDTQLEDGALVAASAAYRSHRKWYALKFRCVARPDLQGVAEFSFESGASIPESEWDSHDLIAEDEDED